MTEATINVGKTVHETLTIRIKGFRLLTIRARIAALIFTFGAWVAGIPLEMGLEEMAKDGTKVRPNKPRGSQPTVI